ncbi:MAG: DF family (seleno)protein [Acidobacteriaceae bacterium]
MKVEVLYIAGCPNHKPAVARVQQALGATGLSAEIEELEVRDAAMAQRVGFLGSPSVRVDELDVEKDARATQSFGFGCRSYADAGARTGLPSFDLIREALLEAAEPSEHAGAKV